MEAAEVSAEMMAGQRLMVGFDGTELNPQLRFLIETLKVGGLILFSANIASPRQVASLCADAQALARSCGLPPLLVAIDQEGGQVARLKEPFTRFAGNPGMRAHSDAAHFARVTARELKSIGVNMNMAPVLDVAPIQMNSIMSRRAFGHHPRWVAEMGASVIDHLQADGIMAVAKHFPGIGRTVVDSHIDLPRMEADIREIEVIDLPPFAAAFRHQVAGCMLAHILYSRLDPRWPASLSVTIAKELLRDRMGYKGVVMTDDLDMGAVTRHFDIPTAVSRILAADIDLVLICHQGPAIEIAFERILEFHTGSALGRQKSVESIDRIMTLKRKYLN